ncbi:MAG: excinuclease ABC subunit A, partial [Muribaculaceae bacterium]|nr:excinuclease ABC subunit A [Muribaculaceae bacterium]
VESLSAYARQFLGRMNKPECDYIKGLPPAIAIEQKVNTRNPRSTVGTTTEIYDYLRMLFARVGRTYSPVSGERVSKHTVDDVVSVAASYPEGTRIAVAAPIILPEGRDLAAQLDIYRKEGFTRLIVNGDRFTTIDEYLEQLSTEHTARGKNNALPLLLIDRLATAASGDEVSRLAESAETAFFEGRDRALLLAWTDDGVRTHEFSKRFEADGIAFPEPSDAMFNFNNPFGACPRCEGFGMTLGIDERLVVPNPALTLFDDAVACWRGETMGEWKRNFIRNHRGFPIHRPYADLSADEKALLWKSINDFFAWVEARRQKVQYRVMLARYRGKTICPDCHGSRLRKEASYVHVADATISDLVAMPVGRLAEWFDSLKLEASDAKIAERLITEIRSRLTFLCEVGLGYLTLDRLSNSLSGGESQRINLATSLGSSLVGSLYILDEPSIGLHPRDTDRLIGVLRKLQGLGNTVAVVEHDEEIMRAADYIIDVGPDAGSPGGEIVYAGP